MIETDQSGRNRGAFTTHARTGLHNPCTPDTFGIQVSPVSARAMSKTSRNAQRCTRIRRSRPISRVLSRTIIHLRYASPRTCSDLPGSTCGPHARPSSRGLGPLAPLFGLAPGGVCRATECCHRRGALLPHHFTLTAAFTGGLAVCFLLHCPWARAPQALPGALPWEPGLSSTLARSDCLADSGAHGGGAGRMKQVVIPRLCRRRAAALRRRARCVSRP